MLDQYGVIRFIVIAINYLLFRVTLKQFGLRRSILVLRDAALVLSQMGEIFSVILWDL